MYMTGLAPEEAKPVMYMVEKRIIDEAIPNDDIRTACAACHGFGQPLSWRRSKAEWQHLQNLHVAMFSQADQQFRRPVGGDGPRGAAPPAGDPPAPKVTAGQVAIEYLTKAAPLHTAEWSTWQSRIRDPGIAGKWLVSATLLGKGKFVGAMVISPGKTKDEFTTTVTLKSLSDGATLTRTGSGLVYAGYSWRGRSSGPGKAQSPDDPGGEAREVLWIAPGQQTAEGRWFWGEYQEFGFDVKLTRATPAPAVVAVAPYALKAGAKDARLTLYGGNLPAELTASDLSLGAGVTVKRIVSHSADQIVVEADVAPDAAVGARDVQVAGAILENAFPVFQKLDYLKVTPETALSRLGGIKFAKGYQQFEAIGFTNGRDGKPNTADDIRIGPADVTWNIEEFASTTYDDDTKFVGALSPTALFTPAAEGPNPARKFSRNNYGEVWVEATAKADKDKFGKPLTGRSYLVVTVPTYQRWDQPEVTQ
jgi:quinohemoprotein amine dehydrogenase